MAEYDRPFWSRERGGSSWLPRDPIWNELHDYDFEMQGPYETGRLLDAYQEWREFRAQDQWDEDGNRRFPATSNYELMQRWRAWRRARRREASSRGPDRAPGAGGRDRPGQRPEGRRRDH